MLRSKLLELEERKRREEIAREKGEAQDVNFGSQIRSYVLHPYTMVKDHRTDFEMGDANRVLDGDLDGFVRAYLHRRDEPAEIDTHELGDRGRSDGRPSPQRPARAPPSLGAVPGGRHRLRVPRLDALPRPRPQGRRGRRSRACRRRSATRALLLDVPQDIEGIDVGPVADAVRARRAARRRGLRRRAHAGF